MKRIIVIVLLALVVLLAGCNKEPEKIPVISDEDEIQGLEQTIDYDCNDIGMEFYIYCRKYGTLFEVNIVNIPHYITLKPNQVLYSHVGSSRYVIVEDDIVVGIITSPDTTVRKVLPSDDFFAIDPMFAVSEDGLYHFCIWKTNNAYVIIDYVTADNCDPDSCYSSYARRWIKLSDLGNLDATNEIQEN